MGTSEPLFLFWATRAVHSPFEPPTKIYDKAKELVEQIDDENQVFFAKRAIYYAQLLFIDDPIGRVMKLVQKKDMYHDMLIVFTSDNGADNCGNNYPLKGVKNSMWDGGIRSSAFASGGALPKNVRGKRSNSLIAAWDWYATFAHLAGEDP